jgi:ABC-type glycerol-3-phosphate transport system substrate-binding protein
MVPVSLAQDSRIVLQVALPEFMRPILDESVLAHFEAENPGVTVEVVYTGFEALSPVRPAVNLDEHLQGVEEYVSSADVLAVTGENLTPEATRAGYFLDLTPLTSSDASLNVADFIPAVWESFQWDQGVWALPVSTDIIVLTYDPAAFDEAGLAYPNENWTMDDLTNAARTLAERDENGDVSVPGLLAVNNGLVALLRSLSGQGFYDANTFPNPPHLSNPTLESLLTTWRELEEEGVIAAGFTDQYQQVPLRLEGSFGLGNFGNDPNQPARQGAPLPGGHAALDVQGFAVSAGTLYPQEAYALAKFLTNSVEIANNPFGVRPARQSLAGAEAPAGDDEGGIVFFRPTSPEIEALVDTVLPNAIPVSELRFGSYVDAALTKMRDDGLDAVTALQEMETRAVANMQTVDALNSEMAIAVATPIPEAVLQPGEITLNFGLSSFINPLPNLEQWDQLMRDFAASDPDVGQVVLDVPFGPGAGDLAESYDCYYLPYNAVPSASLETLLNLDPFLDTDPSFDRNDVVGNTLAQVQRDNRIWALPIDLQPQVLQYHSQQFADAGVPAPENGWTLDAFNDALQMVKVNPEDPAPFVPRDTGTSLMILIAAYGGLPLDYRTNPPTVNFSDPATVDAVRQVLDLAKDGYIDYQELARLNFIVIGEGERTDAIYSSVLNGFRTEIIIGEGEDPYRMTTFPTGSQYSAVSYSIGTAYISASADSPEVCYRWISEIARHPELFSGMPAHRSLINDPALSAAQGEDVVDAYNQIDALLSDPNTIALPTPFAGDSPVNFLLQFWLNRAFDNYVLNDADLATELTTAETYAREYLECTANLPPFDAATQNRLEYFQQFQTCATQVDPTMSNFFAGPG